MTGIVAVLMIFQLTSEPVLVEEVIIDKTSSFDLESAVDYLGIQVDNPINDVRLAGGIKQLYLRGQVEDIWLEVDTLENGKLRVFIHVIDPPKLGILHIKGVEKLKESDIRDTLTLGYGKAVSERSLFRNRKLVLDMYQEKGYHRATAEFIKEEIDTAGRQAYLLNINEGPRIKVKSLRLKGNEQFSDTKLKSQLDTKEIKWFRAGNYNPETFEKDIDKLISFYRNKGYIEARILQKDIVYQPDSSFVDISLIIEEGKRYRIGNISVEGNEAIPTEKLLTELPLISGDIFKENAYQATMQELYAKYNEDGFLYAGIVPRQEVRDTFVDIKFLVNEGEPAFVRYIHIKGNTKTREKVIRRELTIHPGDLFKRSKFIESQQAIFNTQFFENVTPDFKTANDKGDVDISIEVQEKSTGDIQMAIGFNSVTKITGQLGLSDINFLGRGWKWSIRAEFGELSQDFSLGWMEPWLFDTPTGLGFDLYSSNRDYIDYDVEKIGGVIQVRRPIPGVDYTKASLYYRLERVNYADFELDLDPRNPFDPRNQPGKYPKVVSSVTLNLTRDSRNNYLFPSSGSLTSINTKLAGGFLGGDNDINYQKLTLETSWFQSAFWKFVLMLRLNVGFVSGKKGPESIEVNELFRLGGSFANVLRGYPDYDVTPEGNPYGGRAMLIWGAEMQFPLAENQISGAFFFEAGNTWNDWTELNPTDLKRGAGVGFIIHTPMGPLGIDYAYRFDTYLDRSSNLVGRGWEPHFRFRTFF
jgi:outer membrane protein insertion porin family